MKKIVRLTESELKNIVEASVKRAIQEGAVNEGFGKDVAKTVGAGVLGAGLGATDIALDGPMSKGAEKQIVNHRKMSQADQATKEEFGNELKGKNYRDSIPTQKDIEDPKTKAWGESRIRRAVIESIMNLMNEEQA